MRIRIWFKIVFTVIVTALVSALLWILIGTLPTIPVIVAMAAFVFSGIFFLSLFVKPTDPGLRRGNGTSRHRRY